MRARCDLLLPIVLVVAWTAAPAQAQAVATGYFGTNFGGVERGKGGIGGSVGYFIGRLGFELDLERHWHFFKDSDIGNTGTSMAADIDTRATSFMGNLVVPIPVTGAMRWRPYGTAGLGVIRATFQHPGPNALDAHQNDFAFSAGGGVVYSLNSLVGLRVDLRYFRAFAGQDKPLPAGQRGDGDGFYRDYDLWRATFGVGFGFP